MKWTKEQEQAIDIRDQSVLVSAAAGSGKTAVLVERIKQILISEDISLDEILVVTFTKAAASEMREKIVNALPEQLAMIQKSHIGTFHSFALEVIEKYFHLINLEPGFKVCDDDRRILLKNEAMETLFEKRFKNEDKDFLDFLRMYGTSRSEDSVKAMISEVHDFIMSMEKPFPWLDKAIGELGLNLKEFKDHALYKELLKNIEKNTEKAFKYFELVYELVGREDIKSLEDKAAADLAMVQGIIRAFDEDYEKGRTLLRDRTFARFAASKDDKLAYEEIRNQVTYLRNQAKDLLKKTFDKYAAQELESYINEINDTKKASTVLQDLVIDFHEIYSDLKSKKGLLDFSDIEHFALEILSHNEAAEEYREKFKYIFIDEYQDSNLVQEALIKKIQKPNNVFMVGDVKQSIYKFRLAEPEIFLKKYKLFESGKEKNGIKLDLNKNFRSKAPIIETVNKVFQAVMNEDTAAMNYDEKAALNKGVTYQGSLEHEVELHLVDEGKTEEEARLAVSLIKENLALGYYDVKTNEKKELKYKDMVILLRSAVASAEKYKEALEEEGIPAFIDAGDGYYDSLEISVFINLLKTIDNKNQDIALLSVLRSAIFGLTIEEMAVIRGEYSDTSFLKAFKNYAEDGEDSLLAQTCKEILLNIRSWKQRQRYMSLKDFIWDLMLETGFYYYVGALPGGVQRQANLRALADKALAYENSQGKGLFGFINYIEAVKERKIATAPINLVGEADDVVRIMTVHKSKGLEYPFVILGGLGKQFYRDQGKARSFHKDLGLALKSVDMELSCYRKTLLQKLIEDRTEKEALAEEIRILYVALTRAKDKLIMLGSGKKLDGLIEKLSLLGETGIGDSKSYLEMILPTFLARRMKFKVHRAGDIVGKGDLVEKKNKKGLADDWGGKHQTYKVQDEAIENLVKANLDWTYPFETSIYNKAKYSVSELSRKRAKERRPTHEKTISISMQRGTAYHKVIEKLPLKANMNSENSIALFIEQLKEMNLLTEEEAQLIDINNLLLFTNSSLYKRMINADELHREAAFNLVKEEGSEKIIVQGIIDCYFREGEEYVLVDFKTDFSDGSEKMEKEIIDRYIPQIKLYREALERIAGKKVKESHLYLIGQGKSLKI